MELWSLVFVIILIVLSVYFLVVALIAYQLNKKLFLVRGKDPDNPCYLQWEDFPTLTHTPFAMKVDYEDKKGNPGSITIRGYYYKNQNNQGEKGFIVLVHGMFGSHLQYLCDISYLTQAGYEVLAFDQYGVGESDGDNQVSLSQGIYTLSLVLDEVKKRGDAKGRDLILYGHSWGAYCSLAVLKKHPEVKKAVLRSGPCDAVSSALHLIGMKNKPLEIFLAPFLRLACEMMFTHHNLINAASWGEENKTTKVLALCAEDDPMVAKRNSIVTYFQRHPQENVETFTTEKGLHNSIITEESYAKFVAKAKEYYAIVDSKDADEEKARKKEAFIASLDRASYLEYNEPVKEKILSFLGD